MTIDNKTRLIDQLYFQRLRSESLIYEMDYEKTFT